MSTPAQSHPVLIATQSDQLLEVIAAIKKQLPDCALIFLLKRNMETVVRNIGDCDPTVDWLQLSRALEKRSLNDRDLVINKARAEAKLTVRECVLRKNPSLRNIIEGVCGLLVGSSAFSKSTA
jgi:hypothetical protein